MTAKGLVEAGQGLRPRHSAQPTGLGMTAAIIRRLPGFLTLVSVLGALATGLWGI